MHADAAWGSGGTTTTGRWAWWTTSVLVEPSARRPQTPAMGHPRPEAGEGTHHEQARVLARGQQNLGGAPTVAVHLDLDERLADLLAQPFDGVHDPTGDDVVQMRRHISARAGPGGSLQA